MKTIAIGLLLTAGAFGATVDVTKPTWAKDVAPIVYNLSFNFKIPPAMATTK